jgi:hypothetical protein
MTKQGWLTRQFDSAKKDVEELPRWLHDKSASSERSHGSEESQVVHLRDAKVNERRDP